MKKIARTKKRYSRKRAQNRYSNMQIMTRKTTTLRTLYIHVVLNGVICPQILYDIVLYAQHFLLVKFFPKCYFKQSMFRATAKCNVNQWIMRTISTGRGKIGPSYLIKREWWPIIFVFFFETVLSRELSGKVSKKFIGNFNFWGITLKMSSRVSKWAFHCMCFNIL